MTIVICDKLKVKAIPYLYAIIIASNMGGTATLIGDPPNIMIGSAAKLSFMDFIIHFTPIIILVTAVTIPILRPLHNYIYELMLFY